jgi:transcription elongation factor GreA
MEKIPMTASGHAALESELKRRTSEERPRIIEAIAEARGHGDRSENAGIMRRRKYGHNEAASSSRTSCRAPRSSTLPARRLEDHKIRGHGDARRRRHRRKYQIVGDAEADVKQGRISISPDLPRAHRQVEGRHGRVAPGGARSYEIIDVKYK